MLTAQRIPGFWKDILRDIQKVAPDAVIGGGALRDLDHGRPVKDIDIFVRGSRADELRYLRRRLIDAGFTCDEIDPEKMYPVGDGNDVVGVFDIPSLAVCPVQIIMVNHQCSATEIVQRFDYGICRIAFDGKKLFVSDDYLRDKDDEVFRMCLDRELPEALATSVHRYARLVRKYEGWRWVPFSAETEGF